MKKLSKLLFFFSIIIFITISCKMGNFTGDSGTFIDFRDGYEYKWVKIHGQIWMVEDLRYISGTRFNWSHKDDDYGTSYTWELATEVCPNGWHLTSENEWGRLSYFLGGKDVAGGKLKETGTAHWISPNRATNEVSFTALPGSRYRPINLLNPAAGRDYFLIGQEGMWWTSGEINAELAWGRAMYFDKIEIYRYYGVKEDGLSVRCIKDE